MDLYTPITPMTTGLVARFLNMMLPFVKLKVRGRTRVSKQTLKDMLCVYFPALSLHEDISSLIVNSSSGRNLFPSISEDSKQF